jgi:fucose permease
MKKNYQYQVPIVLAATAFFLPGFADGSFDVLNKYLQETVNITKQGRAALQPAYSVQEKIFQLKEN